jgi:YggT family protein
LNVKEYIDLLITVYRYLIIIYILMSWLPSVRESYIGDLLGRIVEPYLRPFRRLIPPIGGVLDLSPIVAILALYFVGLGLNVIADVFV